MDERDAKGQFVEGHAPTNNGKGGRPSKAREAAIIALGQEVIAQKTWRAIFGKAALDALGQIAVDGKAVDDPNSTAAGRNTARTFLRDTLVGKPTEYISTDLTDSPFEQLAAYSADELAAVLAKTRADIDAIRNASGDATDGTDATPSASGGDV